MRALIIALYEDPTVLDLEQEQALALAKTMRDGGRLAPMLLCLKASRLHRRAESLGLPVLAVPSASPRSLWTLLRLWRWQCPHKELLVQTVGEESTALGRRMLSLRGKGLTVLCHAFFLRPPDRCNNSEMRAAHHIFCGSEHVRRRIAAAWEEAARERKEAAPDLSRLQVLAPGIDVEGFAPAEPWREGQHFIFGLQNGLVPRSGAIQTVRAMAALWQRDDLPPWEVRILGSGPRFSEVLDEAEHLGVESRLCLLGQQDAPAVLSLCHAWLAPGNSPEEPPQVLWQGFAPGLPVIASQSELHMERLAGHEESVFLVPPTDPQSLAKSMISLMHDEALRRNLAWRGPELCVLASLDTMAAKACKLFEVWLADALEARRQAEVAAVTLRTQRASKGKKGKAVASAEPGAPTPATAPDCIAPAVPPAAEGPVQPQNAQDIQGAARQEK